MAYDDATLRDDIRGGSTNPGGLIPEEATREIIQSAVEQSVVLSRFRRVNMSRGQTRMPVLAAFPVAYFVGGDTGLKQTTKMAWANKFLNAEEVAVILPIPQSVLDDSDYDLWAEIRPRLSEAIGRTLDAAVFFGTNKPASWPDAVAAAALAAGNAYTIGTNDAGEGGVAEDVNQTMGLVEADGFAVQGFFADRTFRARLRGARATDGQKLLDVGANGDEVQGLPVNYGAPGLWPDQAADASARLIAADWSQFVVGVRQDLRWDVADQAVITDDSDPPEIIYNLYQQDMVALRVYGRFAVQVANPKTHSQSTDADRYPAAILRNAPTP